MTTWWCEHAWIDDVARPSVRVVTDAGVITEVQTERRAEPGDTHLHGVVLPGFANAHSHAFHRALRGRTHKGGGSFWTWREGMYGIAERLDPDSYLALARGTYAEMALAGVTAVGEFHYLHHGPGGVPYEDPNEMAHALRQAALEAGVHLVLLDTIYLAGGLGPDGHTPLDGVQRRFGDGDAERWAHRVSSLQPDDAMSVGAAIHSVRAVPREQMATVRAANHERPLHLHLSEQPAENEACGAFYGATPTGLLEDEGLLGRHTTAVHATHLTDDDIAALGSTGTTACFCPTTERDLADGIGPARALLDAGAPLALGSDQHAVIDLLEEARALEMHERLATLQRGRLAPSSLVNALTVDGQASLGRRHAGRIAVGAPADLVAVALDTPRTAGADPDQIVLAAGAADVRTVVSAGRTVVHDGQHVIGDVGASLHAAIETLWED